jgi:hypothetical protein
MKKKAKNKKQTFKEVLENSLNEIYIDDYNGYDLRSKPYSYHTLEGVEEAKQKILNFVVSDLRRRAKQLRDLVKDVTYDTRHSYNAELLEKLAKEYAGEDDWIYEYKYNKQEDQ